MFPPYKEMLAFESPFFAALVDALEVILKFQLKKIISKLITLVFIILLGRYLKIQNIPLGTHKNN